MAFALLRHLQYHLALTKKLSPETIIATLMEVQASIYVHKQTGDRYRMPGRFPHQSAQIYQAFGIMRSLDTTIML